MNFEQLHKKLQQGDYLSIEEIDFLGYQLSIAGVNQRYVDKIVSSMMIN